MKKYYYKKKKLLNHLINFVGELETVCFNIKTLEYYERF